MDTNGWLAGSSKTRASGEVGRGAANGASAGVRRRLGIGLALSLAAGTAAAAGAWAQPAQAPVQPGAEGAKPPITPPPAIGELGPDDMITLSVFSEPVELSALVEYVATTLGINVTVKGTLSGTVVFNAPVSISKSKLLPLLDALLDQYNWTIIKDATGFYIVQQRGPGGDLPVSFGEMPTTKIIPTPNVRPSALRSAISAQFGGGAGLGQPDQSGGIGGKGIAYVDELGVIVATESPRRLLAIETLVQKLMEEYLRAKFIRLELKYVAAPVARDRALALVGQSSGTTSRFPFQEQQQPQQPQQLGRSAAVDNLADRLTVDPQGNALIFRGAPEEVEQVRSILGVIDVPPSLTPHPYPVGSAAKQVANIARDRGLGEVTNITNEALQQQQLNYGYPPQDYFRQQNPGATTGGPVMVVDETRGLIIYYGTPEQHQQFQALVDTLRIEDETIVLVPYKLKNAKADDVAQLVQGLLTNQAPSSQSAILPQNQTGQQQRYRGQTPPGTDASDAARGAGTTTGTNPATGRSGKTGEGGLSLAGGEEAFVIADVGNNQVIVKAPQKLQPTFKQLIDRLDLRRAQVYIECKIVAVNWTDDFRLAFETQLINAGGTGGVLNTNFGLSSFATGANLNQPKTVATGLAGLTAAIIKSDQVPIIITALQRDVDSRILSSPQLLVDDNEEAKIASLDQEPTATVSQGTSTTETGFGGYQEAGTNLTVTPHISEAGYIRLEYEAELSSFTGQATATLPPPKQQNTVSSKSVTLPSDFTVVIGGLNFDSRSRTVVKVPLLGDIPLVGALFRDDQKNSRTTTLYLFITPRILKDPNFEDLKLLTLGPRHRSKIDADIPDLKPSLMDVLRAGGEQPLPSPVAPPPEPAPVVPPPAAPAVEKATPAPAEGDKPGPTADKPGVVPDEVSPVEPKRPRGPEKTK